MRAVLRWLAGALLFALLTLLTQVGGLVLLATLLLLAPARRRWAWSRGRLAALALFCALYGLVSFALVPAAAPLFGREPLPCFAGAGAPLEAHSLLTCIGNRQYVRPEVFRVAEDLARYLAGVFPGTKLRYLDANFPFWDGFPLLPHMTHNDGRKLDLAFFYRSAEDPQRLVDPPSPLGYWAYSPPEPGEPNPCRAQAWDLRWDFDWLQPWFAGAVLEPERTRAMIDWLKAEAPRYGIRRIVLEEHLQQRLGVAGGIVWFQGCRPGRHDDHTHISVY